MAFAELQAQIAHLTSIFVERSTMQSVPTYGGQDHSNVMWQERQQASHEGYWQPYADYYQQPQQETYWQSYEDSYAPPQPPPQSSHPNSSISNYYEEVIQQLNSLEQGREAQPFQQDAFWQPIEDFYLAKELAEWNNQFGQNAECMEQIQEQMVKYEPMDVLLLLEEEEDAQATAREEQTLPQAPQVPMPSNLGKVVPSSIHSNIIPPNVLFPRRFLIPNNEESQKDIVEALPKVQENEAASEYVECIKEDICETTKPNEVEIDDTGQATTIIVNLAKSKIPETFKDVVFVIEFVTDQKGKPSSLISISFYTNLLLILMIQAPTLEFKPLPDHFKYHPPFKDQFHAMGPKGV